MEGISVGTPALWAGFIGFVLVLLALDLGIFNRRAHEIHVREALIWSGVWIGISLLFNAWIWHHFGAVHGLEFLTGYLLEKALSVDNLFVFIVLFSFFAVPAKLQHRVLFWGILGALVMRALFIVTGAALIHRFHWIIYVFGAFLLFTGVKLLLHRGGEIHPERNPVMKVFRRFIPLTSDYRGARFVVKEGGRWLATPLLMVLVVVEATDIVFAVDSIPAIFAITTDPFIVFTSNIFAIMGLRALYFLLADVADRFHLLKYGLAMVLTFIGSKMLIMPWYHVPVGASLAVVAV
ncbi:MAG: TerC family protein, partial [bacterium]|nr:TerC family protein [bacterium]